MGIFRDIENVFFLCLRMIGFWTDRAGWVFRERGEYRVFGFWVMLFSLKEDMRVGGLRLCFRVFI